MPTPATPSYNSNPTILALADAVAMDPKLKGEAYSRLIDEAANQHNAFEKFTSTSARNGTYGGVRSIFARKTDLSAGGAAVVNFNVIGTPGGPGVMGNQELTGNTSKARMATYPIRVGWYRDGFEMDREMLSVLSAGRSIVETTIDLLGQKMGILRQNIMKMRLIKSAWGNIYRAGNRGSTDALIHSDTLALSVAHSARARLRTIGGKPISHRLSGTGSPIDGYLIMATDQAMLPIRNDSSFNTVNAATAAAHGDTRGAGNAMFTGELLNWGGMPWYEMPIIDESWDDYAGNPMLAKAKIAVAFNADTAKYAMDGITSLFLRGSTATTFTIGSPRYFQFFDGYDYRFALNAGNTEGLDDGPAAADTTVKYAWAVNPDGSCCFLSYQADKNFGTYIQVKNILSAAAGTSTLGATTVGNVYVGVGGALAVDGTTRVITLGGGTPVITLNGCTLVDRVDVGAVLLQANKNGVVYGRGFVFGSMAACYANGQIEMNQIEETRDYGFVKGKGFETILGAGVTRTPSPLTIGGVTKFAPAGYLLLEHAVEHEGYPTPYAA